MHLLFERNNNSGENCQEFETIVGHINKCHISQGLLNSKTLRDGLLGKDTYCQACQPEFDPLDPCGGRKEQLPVVFWSPHMCSGSYMTTHAHTKV